MGHKMKAPSFPLYVRDWLCSRSIFSMSGDAAKAYTYLLCESWLQIPRATIPSDEKEIASMARVKDDDWPRIRVEIMKHFKKGTCQEHKGRLYSERLLEISRNCEKNQRPNNKNAQRTRIKHEGNAE